MTIRHIQARSRLAAGAALIALVAGAAHGQTAPAPPPPAPTPLETQPSTATDANRPAGSVAEVVVVARAVHVAPSAVPLNEVQPTSQIQKEFIQNNLITLASFDDIVKFAPSVWDQSPNGPGLGKSETLSIRGFQDGQFNVTFDGIPFGDSTDFHHTSSALWVAHDIGEAQVDRGPGTAATIGDATFGGSMDFVTKAPLETTTTNIYGTIGSFKTYGIGGELDTGKTPFGKAFIDVQDEISDGYLTDAEERRWNLMAKDVYDIEDRASVTLEASYNHAFEYTTQGATLANIQAFGPNFGLTGNPAQQSYYAYQPSHYDSDFEYVDFKDKITRHWSVEDEPYTVSFGHYYAESKDASQTGAAANGVTYYTASGAKESPQPTGASGDVPGKLTWAYWRSFGNILRLVGDYPFGEIQAGLWIDRNNDKRWSESTDLTADDIPTGSKSGTPYSYYILDHLTTVEPYVELDWHILPNLTLEPGVRYTDFMRNYDAPINKTANTAGLHEPADYSGTYTSLQPSIEAKYNILEGWSAYLQVAKGFLAPPINVLEVNTSTAPPLKPEETWNYQVGTTLHRGRLVVGLDAYNINFSNFITSPATVASNVVTYVNGGGAIYEGVEFEGQYVLDHGFSLYANATYNYARFKHTDVWLADSPEFTSAFGVLFDDKKGPYASIIAKWVGGRYGLDVPLSGVGLGNVFWLDPFITADVAAGWHFRQLMPGLKDFTVSVKVSNLFDNTKIDDYAGQQSATSAAFPDGAPLFWTVAGRAVFANLSASF
jgi:iron complex outermembrane receptor protein